MKRGKRSQERIRNEGNHFRNKDKPEKAQESIMTMGNVLREAEKEKEEILKSK